MKSLIEKAFFLKKIPLFNELELELLLAIAEKLYEEDYDAEEKIFTTGQVANRIYFIVSGKVQIFDEKSRPLFELNNDQFFGDESLFNERSRAYSATCKTDSVLFSLSRSHLLSIISECPSVAIGLLQVYSSQLPCRYS